MAIRFIVLSVHFFVTFYVTFFITLIFRTDYWQVREKCCAWLYEHPDGKLGRDCFSEMIRETLPDFTAEEAEQVELHVFRIYDTNGDGVISFHEFMTVFMILTGDEPRTVLEKMFLIFDVDNSGLITKVC